jgi:hypothetical protein
LEKVDSPVIIEATERGFPSNDIAPRVKLCTIKYGKDGVDLHREK